MSNWLRRIRGAVGMGLTWAAAWFGAGMIILVGLVLVTGSTGADVPYPLFFGALGFLGGVTFSGVLGLAEGHRRFDQMSLPRFAGWGAAGGVLLSTVFVSFMTLIEGSAFLANLMGLGVVFALAGAGCAGGSLMLARRAEDRASLASGEAAEALALSSDGGESRLGGGIDSSR